MAPEGECMENWSQGGPRGFDLICFVYLFFWPCCLACGMLVPRPGIEPTLEVLTTGLPGKSPHGF